jgi:hypothetical protein
MKICPKCKNVMQETMVRKPTATGRTRKMPSGEYSCPYCIWKGDEGPGLAIVNSLGNKISTKRSRTEVSRAYADYCENNPEATQEDRKAEYQRLHDLLTTYK